MRKDPVTVIDRIRVLEVRGQAVVLDSDLAAIYGVQTKVPNKAVNRNLERFPEDFPFQLNPQEVATLRFQFGTSKGRGGRRYRPWTFTERGAIMAATVLNSPEAVAMSVYAGTRTAETTDWLSRWIRITSIRQPR